MTFPGFSKLFTFCDPVAKKPYRGQVDRGELMVGLSRGELVTDVPIGVFWAMGSAMPGDIVWTTSASPVIVHGRVIELLQRGHIFAPDTWDGSDLFMEAPDQMGRVSTTRMMTDQVRRALANAKVRNIEACSLLDKSVSTSVYTIGLKHLLPPDFAERVTEAYVLAGVPRPEWV
jgi:hypothetical protein